MGLRIGSIVVNCVDIELMTRFWTQALDMVAGSDDPEFRVLGGGKGINLSLQVARTPVTARDQMHLDLYSDDAPAQIRRLVELGATFVRENDDPADTYTVLRDPEGNEFCVCSS